MKHRFNFVLFLALISIQVQADDVTRDVIQGGSGNSAYAEIGFEFAASYIPLLGFGSEDRDHATNTTYFLGLDFDGRIQYRRFFAEVIDDSFSEVTIGFSVFDNDRASLELIATSYFLTLERSGITGFETIEDRPGDINLGIRSSHFFNNNLIQIEVVSDVAEHKGVVGAIHLGRHKQLGNWSLYGLAGVRYFSQEALDHLLGVSAIEATEALPEYEAGAGAVVSLQLGATLPLSEKWTFSAKAEYGSFSNAITKSPLALGNDMNSVRFSFNYVLFN